MLPCDGLYAGVVGCTARLPAHYRVGPKPTRECRNGSGFVDVAQEQIRKNGDVRGRYPRTFGAEVPARVGFTVRPTRRSAVVVGADDAVEMTPTNCGLPDYSGDTRLAIG